MNLIYVNAEQLFISKLKNVTDPEKKRKIIGRTFIDIFDNESVNIKTKEEIKKIKLSITNKNWKKIEK